MNKYIVYKIATGEIVKNIACTNTQIGHQLTVSEDFIGGYAEPDDEYIVDGVVAARPEMTGVTAEGSLIVGIPSGALVSVSNSHGLLASEQVDDGGIALSTDDTGDYIVKIDLFPFLPLEVAVNVA